MAVNNGISNPADRQSGTIDAHDFETWWNFRFSESAASSSEIVYHTGNPTPAGLPAGVNLPYGGSATEGLAPGDTVPAAPFAIPDDEQGQPIDASKIRDTIINYGRTLNQVRRVRIRVNVTGSGGNTGTQPNPGIIYDQSFLANVPANIRGNWATGSGDFLEGNVIDNVHSENYFQDLAALWQSYRDDNLASRTFTFDICHSSCHSSCHGSRGRR